ncbi:MAG: MarR family transcriptional regulator [Mesorhizobium sp.]|nr:MarR family transcriptional regulator [Mesorhizobium sp.]MCO5164453.1 MarR family transcriptional regulator [Mesorhizobium sp.]
MNKMQDLPWDNPRFRNWIAVVQAEKAIVRALTKALQPFDLKIAQLDLLMNLYRHPGASQHDIARKLLVGRSNVTMLMPQMEKQGLIVREADAKDKRVLRLQLTPKGEDVLLRALKAYTALIDRVMASSTPAQCDAMGDTMRKISEMLKDE